jgi:hypothetical protein
MADNVNKQDLQDNTGELNRFNDSLRESIDLSRSLSKNVKSVTDALKLSKGANSELYADLSKYNDALKQAQNLSKRLLTGRVKEQEVSEALRNIEKTYGEYMTRNNKSFGERGRFTLRQKDLQEELNKLADKEVKRQEDIASADARIDSLRRDLAVKETARQATMSSTQRKIEDKAIKAIKEQIKEESELIRVIEGGAKNNERIISRKAKELEKVEEILEAHKGIQRQYEEEIKANEILLDQVKKQNLQYRLTKGGIDGLTSGLKDIKNLFGPFTAIFEFIKKIAFGASDQVVRIQKGLVASKEEAYALRQEFNDAAVASGEISVNTERMIAANSELGKQLGFNSRFSNDMNIQFIKLTKQLGISEEAAGGLAKLTKANGLEFKDVKNTVYQTTQALSSQNGIQIDQREVMEEVGKITGQTLAMLKGNPKALTEAVVQAKLLGTTLESAKKSGAALLDFESSIENELQAELITGKQFNLERARSAALTGDLTTEMKELANQGIDFNNYSNMNVIAQQKIADMMGKTTDELTDQLLKQQYLGMSHEQIAAMSGEEVANRVEALNAQDKFNLAMEKMQDIVGRIVGGPLGQFADMMASLLENSYVLYGVLGAMAGISFVKLVAGLAASAVQAGILAAGTITASSAITFGLSAIAIAAGIGLMMAAFTKSKDEAAQPMGDGFFSKGKTLISTKEGGLFEPSSNDDIAIAPGIGDIINKPKQQTAVVQDNSALLNELKDLNKNTLITNQLVQQSNNKKSDIYMGPDKVGTSLLKSNYSLA